MLDLNSQHIEQIRNYFIATNDEEKQALQNSIVPMFLKGFLNDLKKLFILDPGNSEKLISIAKSMGAAKHIEALKEIQQQFYSQLAETYLKSEANNDIDQLIQLGNQSFLEEVVFQEELQKSFIISERELLKKKFVEIDRDNDISTSEIEDAFKLTQRASLKKMFGELDSYSQESIVAAGHMVAEASVGYGDNERNINSSTIIKKINFSHVRFQ